MKKTIAKTYLLLTLLLCLACSSGKTVTGPQYLPEIWWMESVTALGKHPVQVLGEPKVVKVAKGESAVAFDGKADGLLVAANPIAGADEFTIEVVLKVNDAFPENVEQRFLHIEDPANENRRILMELRLVEGKKWYADFYMRNETERLTLIDSTKTHPLNEWATMTLLYKDKKMTGYVNGVKEVEGAIEYQPISAAARTSLGTRMDKRSWFNGQIKTVKFIKRALPPLEP